MFQTDYGQTALTVACRLGSLPLGAESLLHSYCYCGQQLLTRVPPPRSLSFLAAEILIDQGADINKETQRGLTPLTEAARGNHHAIVQMLLNRCARAASACRWSISFVGLTAFRLHVHCRRVNVPHKTRLRMTAAKIASINNNKDIHRVLATREVLEKAHEALLKAIMLSDVESVCACPGACTAVPLLTFLCRRVQVTNMVQNGEPYRMNHMQVLEHRYAVSTGCHQCH